MTRLHSACVTAVTVALAWGADLAYACPSCTSPLEENRQAFVDTTIFLTLVPLLMIGGFIWWIRRKTREIDAALEITVPETLLQDAGRFSKRR
ncbi:MAG: hypothetical protein WCE62_07330 [Polyangiales bacterium]